MSFELISADIDAALNIHQVDAGDNMNLLFGELVESGDLTCCGVDVDIFLVARLTDASTNGSGPTKELCHARNLQDNLSEFVNSLGSRPNTDVWDDLLKRLRIQVDEATVADKENEEPGQKTGCLFSNGKNMKGKRKKRKILKGLCIRPDESAVATVVVKDNDEPSLRRRRRFPEEKSINRNKKSSRKEKDSTGEGLSQDEQGNMGGEDSSVSVISTGCFTFHSNYSRWRTLVTNIVTGGREACHLRCIIHIFLFVNILFRM